MGDEISRSPSIISDSRPSPSSVCSLARSTAHGQIRALRFTSAFEHAHLRRHTLRQEVVEINRDMRPCRRRHACMTTEQHLGEPWQSRHDAAVHSGCFCRCTQIKLPGILIDLITVFYFTVFLIILIGFCLTPKRQYPSVSSLPKLSKTAFFFNSTAKSSK